MTTKYSILMVEDSDTLADIYSAYLADQDYDIEIASDLRSARRFLEATRPDVVLLDIALPDGSGMDLLTELQSEFNPPQVIVMTAHGTSNMAVQAIAVGASDFLTKPFDAARLQVTLDNALSRRQLGRKLEELSTLEKDQFESFIGASPAMQSVYRTLDSLAASDATGFIVGESGTGKELAAEAIHKRSNRRKNEFVAINCGAIPSELMESELFGHVKGAFTGASSARDGAASVADGGTLFLDEICEMSLELQKKLLRFIQTGTFRKVGSNELLSVDVRFVCATNRDPLEEVKAGRFREDLFYRLHVVPVRMPPLRERGDDILTLAEHFLEKFSSQENKAFTGFAEDAAEVVRRYPWPGNVRQLENSIQQITVLHEGQQVSAAMLPDQVKAGDIAEPSAPSRADSPQQTGRVTAPANHIQKREMIEPLWLVEQRTIQQAIELCGGNVNQAAGLLEVAPSTLYRKIQSWKKQQA